MTSEKGSCSGISAVRLRLELRSPETGTSSISCATGKALGGLSQCRNNEDRQLKCERIATL
jgi:hypothetical protein